MLCPRSPYNNAALASPSIVIRFPSLLPPSRTTIASRRLFQVGPHHASLYALNHSLWAAQITRALSTGSSVKMPPVTKPGQEKYDIVFIGGGSGGVAGSVSSHSRASMSPFKPPCNAFVVYGAFRMWIYVDVSATRRVATIGTKHYFIPMECPRRPL